jgi:hypothetical protein
VDSTHVLESLAKVDPQEWNALAGGQPFVRHEFISALLETGCASARTGWRPRIIVLRQAGALAGAMPLFEKSHSYGEYVFDWAWADAYERHGLAYYPKLVGAVPFTPVQGTRLLARDKSGRAKLLARALDMARQASSLHVLFPQEDEMEVLLERGLLPRRTVQFHWRNEGYRDFEDFLSRLTHSRRKNIRQERRKVREAGVALRWLEAEAITREHWEFFHRCYRNTYRAHASSPYLTLEFFLRLAQSLPRCLALVMAEQQGAPLACALFLRDESRLYGRYWGCVRHVPLLHFECCYYQPIEYAIAQGISTFEGGAQGEHKLFRGLLPVEVPSAHWLAHPAFARAIQDFLAREGAGVARYVDELCEHSPFRDKGANDAP